MPREDPDQQDQPQDLGLDLDGPYTPSWGDLDAARRDNDVDHDVDPIDRVNDWSWENLDVWDNGYDNQAEFDTPEAQAHRRRILPR